jgi:hypothetical protein
MSANDPQGIPSAGLDDAFRAEEARKSNLLLEAQLLEAQGQADAATTKYATAAAIEERLGARARELGLKQLAWVHETSAVGCWARAGNFFTAEQLADQVLADTEIPDRLRRSTRSIRDAIRAQRREWADRARAAESAAVPA